MWLLSQVTVSRILHRAGLNRLRSLDPPPPMVRYDPDMRTAGIDDRQREQDIFATGTWAHTF